MKSKCSGVFGRKGKEGIKTWLGGDLLLLEFCFDPQRYADGPRSPGNQACLTVHLEASDRWRVSASAHTRGGEAGAVRTRGGRCFGRGV